MIKQLELRHWKSFESATLYIDPLTVLIGLNASGKSNVLDALLFLQKTVSNRDLFTALRGENEDGIRGGLEWAAMRGFSIFSLKILIGTEDKNIDYSYFIEIEVDRQKQLVNVVEEKLLEIVKKKINNRFYTKIEEGMPTISAYSYTGNSGKGKLHLLARNVSVLSQLRYQELNPEVKAAVKSVVEHLENIFILDIAPQNMRGFPALGTHLKPDGSNVAGVIASLPEEKQQEILATISQYARILPERELQEVKVTKIGLRNYAMLSGKERWIGDELQEIDAQNMSDGTLRFIATLTAILTRKKGSLLVIEEIDNGIHPSRTKLLIEILRKEGEKAGIDILVTSHNTTFLNELGAEFIPFISVAHRDKDKGVSQLTLVEDIEDLPRLLSKGLVGTLSANGSLQKALQ